MQFIVEDAEPIDHVRLVLVELSADQASDIVQQQRLKELLLQQKRGGALESARCRDPSRQRSLLCPLKAQFRVDDPEQAVQALQAENFQARAEALLSST
ncbi:hypothetical protein [Synechococcus elongatus]|uniref:hypothetical protein n=1 Tax=Synechococcus elongatus TaxID=32046 RepID=UPI0030CD7C8D